MIQDILNYSSRVIGNTKSDFVRYLYSVINWQSRLIEINGGRGVGKTTLLLQRAQKLNDLVPNQAVVIGK